MGIESSKTSTRNTGLSGGSIHRQTRPVALGIFHPYVKKTGCLFGCSHRSLSPIHCRGSYVRGPRCHPDRRSKKIGKTWNGGGKTGLILCSSPFVNKLAGSDEYCHGLDTAGPNTGLGLTQLAGGPRAGQM